MSEYLRLTDGNQKKFAKILQYAENNPELIQRVRGSNVRVNRNNVLNALIAEFYYLFVGNSEPFLSRERSLLETEKESLDQTKLIRKINLILQNQERLMYLNLIINEAANVLKTPTEAIPSKTTVRTTYGQWTRAIDERIDDDIKERRKP